MMVVVPPHAQDAAGAEIVGVLDSERTGLGDVAMVVDAAVAIVPPRMARSNSAIYFRVPKPVNAVAELIGAARAKSRKENGRCPAPPESRR